jgi:hypothetical protein
MISLHLLGWKEADAYFGLVLANDVLDKNSLGPTNVHQVLFLSERVDGVEDSLRVILQLASP